MHMGNKSVYIAEKSVYPGFLHRVLGHQAPRSGH